MKHNSREPVDIGRIGELAIGSGLIMLFAVYAKSLIQFIWMMN